MQYTDEVTALSSSTGIKPFCVYGGFSKTIQVNKLNDCVHILIATPGRLIDHLYDRTIDLSHVKCVILDEADELLNSGFLPDTEFILSCIVHEHQTLLFSATMPEDIKKLSHDYLKEPVRVDLIQKRSAPACIDHYFTCLPFSRWQEKLVHYIRTEDYKQMLIFCDSRIRVEKVFKALKKDIPDIEFIHAGLTQEKRSSIFNRFKKQKIRCLIATDVAGRGLDFSHVTHVVNWGLPRAKEQYTHRTGRTGRMGRSGKAMTLLGNRDLTGLKGIIRKNKIKPRWIGGAPSIR
jgi:ATP-dependent RNA helicase DeaD